MAVVNLSGADQQAAPAGVDARYRGFSVRNTSASAVAALQIFEGTDASGPVLEEVSLAPSESAREYYSDWAFQAPKGIFVHIISGSFSGSIRYS